MQAVMFTETRDFELTDRPVPEPADGEVLLRVELCGICGTDLHAPLLEDLFTKPVVLGHEFTASVAAAGGGVSGIAIGERVVVNPIGLVCGNCPACLIGRTNMCERALTVDCCGVGKDGGMAEYIAVDSAYIHPIATDLPAEVGAWTEPLAVAVRGVRRAGIQIGERIAVLGAGPIGQLTLQVALAAGASEAAVVESSAYRREIATRCGASLALAPGELADLKAGYDVVFDCTGAAPALDSAISIVAPAGRIVVIGTYAESPTISAPLEAHFKELSITFSVCYLDRGEFEGALDLLERGAVDVRPLTTAIEPIESFAEAMDAMRVPDEAIKILLRPPS
jgi:2-desacetyl-2-hydroxyethyl bacteriochlorophyllide A dehydrogenase